VSVLRLGAVAARRRRVGVPRVCGNGRRHPVGIVPESEALTATPVRRGARLTVLGPGKRGDDDHVAIIG